MEGISSFTILAFSSLFAVLNPFATVPPFIAMTESNSVRQRIAMARRGCYVACAVLIVFSLSGMHVLNFFGVSVPAFKIAGGLVLIRVAFELLQGSRNLKIARQEEIEGVQKDDISVIPLGIPILCGPATIATGILVSSEAVNWLQTAALVGVIVGIYFGIYVLLKLASRHSQKLGETAIMISSRMMGLILVAIAVQFVVEGVREAQLFPMLAGG